ncbi:hybrid sensor histidine kinase/response regulator transcription factor [Desertivirga xinjiangensis]|uniref:hybrid sensor histidine kinase/response regulator transcription factor n=1 Tax=Desertivirga xinjiangensis TaxID=539206 RepID=UPI00210EC18B|nr:two-component regulator propeller domain-containing protein [Pedobacter xinjiangensis]
MLLQPRRAKTTGLLALKPIRQLPVVLAPANIQVMKCVLKTFIYLLTLLVFVTTPAQLYAQPGQVVFENYTLEDGLQNNTVQQAFQDSKGYMWFATNHGVCRYDGSKFTSFRNDPRDSTSLSGLLARVVYEDKAGNLWIGTESGGLNRFNREKEKFEHILTSSSTHGIGTSVKNIAEDKSGRLWLGTNIGLKMYDPKSGKVRSYPFKANSTASPSDTYVRVVEFDSRGKLWVGTNAGLDLFDPASGRFKRMYANTPGLGDEIWEIYKEPEGMLWVGTYNNGLFRIDPVSEQIETIHLNSAREWSNTIRSVVRDEQGLYWIGSRAGLYIYNAKNKTYSWFGNIENEPKSLVNNSILDIYKDNAKNLWICTRGGISLMVPGRQAFRYYNAFEKNSNHLNNNEVYAFWEDKASDRIWIGTGSGGVNILDRKTGKFSYMTHSPGNPNSIAGNSIKTFLEDGKGNVWIGTYKEGISVYNLKTKKFTHLRHNANPSSLANNSVWALHKDKKGNIWVGTDAGLDLYNEQTNSFIHQNISNKKQKVAWINEDSKGNLWLGLLSMVAVYEPEAGTVSTIRVQGSCFYEDAKGRRWLASRNDGLILLGANNKPAKYYDERDGLPNNQVFQILEDKTKNLWLSTANGLARFDPSTESFTNYDKRDGLQNNQFHYGAAFKLKSGELVFGGVNGFNVFDPGKVARNNFNPPVVLTDLKIFNKSVRINDQFNVLENSISESQKISIPYQYNILTFEFSALNFVRPEKNKYKFRMIGFDKNWNEAGATPTATYTNLDPGTYTFAVIASNNDNQWNDNGLQIQVEILPPFWKTWWFNSLALITVLGLIYLVVEFIINRQKIKQQLDLERIKVKQLNEVNDIKLRFFTNISHEIRTPLTLIIGPLERFRNSQMDMDIIRTHSEIMYRNATALLKLVNQLLDFRKLESGNLTLDMQKGDIVVFIKEIVDSFTPMAEEKGIKLNFSSIDASLLTYFDPDKLEKILNNLLSNALKFTGKQGAVSVYMTLKADDSFDSNDEFIEIVVRDTGIGIDARNRERIFHQFFQVPENKDQGGTGIGLALTKELVKLHKGEILVDSQPGKGTRFTVRIPLVREEVREAVIDSGIDEEADPNQDTGQKKDLINERILLIIEDNPDVRKFLRVSLESQFHIEEAGDGMEGLQLAQKFLPDIILSDVMMPVLDGNELCKRLKADEYTSHIPIILLTALSSKEHTIAGLSSGADDFITKPFDISILQTKIENLLALRNSIRKKFEGKLVISPTNIEVTSPDEVFLRKAVEVVEKNIDDTDLDIETFSKEMAVSRMQMYRKLSVLTGMTVKEFIRDIRLKRAVQLLDQKKLNVSEVAYAVGFKDLSHFRKCFREKYGMNATEYLKRNENGPLVK